MIEAWVAKNAIKFVDIEGANFYVPSQRAEEIWLKHVGFSPQGFENEVLTNKTITVALLNLWDKRNFELNEVPLVRDNTEKIIKVDGVAVKSEKRYEGFRTTQISGILMRQHLFRFIQHLLGLDSFSPVSDDLTFRVTSINENNSILYLPAPWARDELFDLRDDQLHDIFLKDQDPRPVVDLKSLILIFSDGEKVGISWIAGRIYYMNKFPTRYSNTAFNAKIKTPPKLEDFRIEGPYTLTEWKSEKRGIHIFLFGDKHVLQSVCPPGVTPTQSFADFIRDTIKANPNKTIDLYFEELFKTERKPPSWTSNNYLSKTMSAFPGCFERDKKYCAYKNARFHYVDVRNLGSVKMGLDLVSRHYKKLSQPDSVIDEDPQFFDLEIKGLLAYGDAKGIETTEKATKVQKQLDDIEDRKLVAEIVSHFRQKLNTSMDGIRFLWLSIRDLSREDRARKNMYLIYRILDWISIWLDYYMVARMFRSYKISKEGRSSEPARNVIGYMGNAHCDGISEFLRTLPDFFVGERSESKTEGKDHQCLRVSSRLPLFKYD